MKKALPVLSVLLGGGTSGSAAAGCRRLLQRKTLRIVVGVGVGSGYDLNARALARPPRRTAGQPP